MPVNYGAIPQELRAVNQWVVYRLEANPNGGKPLKPPYDAKTGFPTSVKDWSGWSQFDYCVSAVSHFSGIGFCLTQGDSWAVLDLDNGRNSGKAQEIIQYFQSWTEISQSGNGYHIFIKARMLEGMSHRANLGDGCTIEIYDRERYIAMTGDVYLNAPIADCQDKFEAFYKNFIGAIPGAQVVPFPQVTGAALPVAPDNELMQSMVNAENGAKVLALLQGDWQSLGLYPTQSEADAALITMLCFYSPHDDQVERIFRASALGLTLNRKKGHEADYIRRTIKSSRAKPLAPVIPQLAPLSPEQIFEIQQRKNGVAVTIDATAEPMWLEYPPGRLGELAQFFKAISPRPVDEISIAAAIALAAAITGRAYNVSGTGLNLYLMVLAETGSGKDALAAVIEHLIAVLERENGVIIADDFLGPSRLVSAAGIMRTMLESKTRSFVSILSEFADRLQEMLSRTANKTDREIISKLAELYTKSGHGRRQSKEIYSKAENSFRQINSPAMTLLCEGQPIIFYKAITDSAIDNGFIPRFIVREYVGPRPPINTAAAFATLDNSLRLHIVGLVEIVFKVITNIDGNKGLPITVQVTQEATAIFNEVNRYCDELMNGTSDSRVKGIYNRVHLNVMRLASVASIFNNYQFATVGASEADWAAKYVFRSAKRLCDKFVKGETGDSLERDQMELLDKVLRTYINTPHSQLHRRDKITELEHSCNIIPYWYLQPQTQRACFINDRIGHAAALKRCVDQFINLGKLSKYVKANTSALYYVVNVN